MTPEALNERFAIPGVLRFEHGPGGLVRAAVTTASSTGHAYLHGAHVTHYQALGQSPLLFTSSSSRYSADKAIRGGVPIIFPWFGPRAADPGAPEHGFARTAGWSVESVEQPDDVSVAVVLGLEPIQVTRALWRHEFRIRQRVVFGPRLEMRLEVENRSSEPFTFEEALHTYLRVGDVREVTLRGLAGTTYIDKTDGMKRKREDAETIRFRGATDRVFLETDATCVVEDPVLGRRLVVEKHGSATTVVWNPWSEKAQVMTDLGADEWRSMLCVETANAADDAVHLAPGERHVMAAIVRSA